MFLFEILRLFFMFENQQFTTLFEKKNRKFLKKSIAMLKKGCIFAASNIKIKRNGNIELQHERD